VDKNAPIAERVSGAVSEGILPLLRIGFRLVIPSAEGWQGLEMPSSKTGKFVLWVQFFQPDLHYTGKIIQRFNGIGCC